MSTAEKKVAGYRLGVLQLAQTLGSVAEACRQRGVARSKFYELKRRFQLYGLEGLKDLPPVHKSHPMTTPKEAVERILTMSDEAPAWGCKRLAHQLRLEGVSVSSPTVQRILIQHGRASLYERLLLLEQRAAGQPIDLTPNQIAALEKLNPCFRERHVESSRPGELLAQDTFFVGYLKGVGKVYMQAVVDTYSSFAFVYLHTQHVAPEAAFVLHSQVLPTYKAWGIPVGAVLTDNGTEYCGKPSHPFELYLQLNDIEHRRTKVRRPQTNGFVERFNRTVLDEFFRLTFRKTFYAAIDPLQANLDTWLHSYNYDRPHQGYRNLGKRPFDRIDNYRKLSNEKIS